MSLKIITPLNRLDCPVTEFNFPPGFSIVWDQQIYRPVGSHPHTKADGSIVTLLDWETECPRCGANFLAATTLTFDGPVRRCQDCRALGVGNRQHIKTMRRKLRRQVAGHDA